MVEHPRISRRLLTAAEPVARDAMPFLRQSGARYLMQDSPQITAVRSAQELVQAVEAGACAVCCVVLYKPRHVL